MPATFIYHDLKHNQFGDSIIAKYHPTPTFEQSYLHTASGNRVMKYSAGQAVVMSPFFFIAHVWARIQCFGPLI
ncbi:MAG: hypothetical protein ABIV51_13525 [Saprospiraceae bacterium]